jgi:nucleoside-diphosphate-sugar epimerase
MSLAVIGCTGFVGGTLCRQADVTGAYHSRNIEEIRGREFDTIVCAGAPGAKWKANQNPEADLANILRLIENLRAARANQFVLISTVDVYRTPWRVDEETSIDRDTVEPYGKYRYLLELHVREIFPHATVIRLPGLFGTGLRKNFIFDLLNQNALHLTHHASTFQFYDMSQLWDDIQRALARRIPLVNFATEPVKAEDVARRCFGREFINETERPPVHYDMRTRFAGLLRPGVDSPYIQSAEYTIEHVRELAASCRLLGVA